MHRRRMNKIVKEINARYNLRRDSILIYINNKHYISINILHLNEHKLLYIFSNLIKWLETLKRLPVYKDINTKIILLNKEL